MLVLAGALPAACATSATRPHAHGATLNVRRAERRVADEILRASGAPAAVLCPSELPRRVGYAFTCTASLEVGTAVLTVTETNASGGLRYVTRRPLLTLDTAKVERAIRTSLARRGRLGARVTCPRYVLKQDGLAFSCSAVVAGTGKRYFLVSEVDGKGNVRLEG